jgi:uncharacterized protein
MHLPNHGGPRRPFALPILILLLLASFIPAAAWALDVPALQGRVNDYAQMISPQVEGTLNDALAELEQTDSTQIVVLTVPSLEGENLEAFSMRVAEAWKIGQSQDDNGAILLVSKNDHKIRIEVGYGLEGNLTDVLSGTIIDNVIAPRFKQGDFDGGFVAGIVAMIQAVRGEYTAPKEIGPGDLPIAMLAILMLIIPGFLIGLNSVGTRIGRRGSSVTRGSLPPFIFWGGGFGGGNDHTPFGGGGFGGFSGGGGGGFGGGGASGGW